MQIDKEQVKEKIRSKTKSVIILFGISVALVIVAIISNQWFAKQTIRTIKITGNNALSNGEINSIIDKQIMNVKNEGLNLNAIKNTLLSNEYIRNANVWINSKGVLGIDIEERNPIAILIDKNGNTMFIDETGKQFGYKLYKDFIDIPVVRNIDSKNINKDIILILLTLKNDYPLLNAKISEIEYNKKGYKLHLTLGDVCVNIGNTSNLKNKLFAIQSFINNVVLSSNDLKKYRYLDARWKDRIVVIK